MPPSDLQPWRARRLGPLSWRIQPDASEPLPYASGPLPALAAVPSEPVRDMLKAAAHAALATAGRVDHCFQHPLVMTSQSTAQVCLEPALWYAALMLESLVQ